MRAGFTEVEILNWPIDKYEHYLIALFQVELDKRSAFVQDVMGGIGAALSKDGFKTYSQALEKSRNLIRG